VLIVLVTLLVLLVGACGSGPPAAVREAPRDRSEAPSAKTPDDRGIVVAFGDSLTAGLGVARGRSYPDFLQQEIDRRSLPFRVINEGVSGDTTDMGLARVSTVIARAPDFVVVEFGGNDGLRALPIDRMKENLRQIIRQLQENGAVVVLAGMRLPPNYGPAYTAEFESTYVQLAQEMDVPFVRFLLEGVGGNLDLMQEDGVHPTAEGSKRVAQNVFAVLGPLLAEAEHSRLREGP
jgi:acyl-CoA thioesterase-1